MTGAGFGTCSTCLRTQIMIHGCCCQTTSAHEGGGMPSAFEWCSIGKTRRHCSGERMPRSPRVDLVAEHTRCALRPDEDVIGDRYDQTIASPDVEQRAARGPTER